MSYNRKGHAKVYDTPVKLLLIGESGVGKSCLLLRYCDNQFTHSYITTIGIDFKVKNVSIDDEEIKLQIWDTAGQERFRNITLAYFRGAMGIILVYDISDVHSFQSVHHWMSSIKENASDDIDVVLVGNKCDMMESRQVSTQQGKELGESYNIPFFETSAKTGYNVETTFTQLARLIIKRLKRKEIENAKDDLTKLKEKVSKKIQLDGNNSDNESKQGIKDHCSCNNINLMNNIRSTTNSNNNGTNKATKNNDDINNNSGGDNTKTKNENDKNNASQNSGNRFRKASIKFGGSLRLPTNKFKSNKNEKESEDKENENKSNVSDKNNDGDEESFQVKFASFQNRMKETARKQKDRLETSRRRLIEQRNTNKNKNENENKDNDFATVSESKGDHKNDDKDHDNENDNTNSETNGDTNSVTDDNTRNNDKSSNRIKNNTDDAIEQQSFIAVSGATTNDDDRDDNNQQTEVDP